MFLNNMTVFAFQQCQWLIFLIYTNTKEQSITKTISGFSYQSESFLDKLKCFKAAVGFTVYLYQIKLCEKVTFPETKVTT